MDTNDFATRRALRNKKLFQIEFIDVVDQPSAAREQFIALEIHDPKTPGGVKFIMIPYNVSYRFETGVDSNGNPNPLPPYRLVKSHFIVPVTDRDFHLKTFLSKIKRGSKVYFTVWINETDEMINRLGLEKHMLTGRIGNSVYLLASWVGKPDHKAPVQYPRMSQSITQPNNDPLMGEKDCRNCVRGEFTKYNKN